MLYLVPTPIGNLEDMTLRAIRILGEVALVLAEDTRTSRKLLDHFGIRTPVRSFHAFNEHAALADVVSLLEGGSDLALISDAGTPGISDPGFLLVRECVQRGIEVICLPGPTAFVPALVVSGIPCDRFHFEGFLPHKKGRQTRLQFLASLTTTFVLYESPNRLVRCLEELERTCGGERLACVCRELTKIHEEKVMGTLADQRAAWSKRAAIKGEVVIVVSGSDSKKKDATD